MIPEGMTHGEAMKRHAEIVAEAQKKKWATGRDYIEHIRKAWAKECGVDYVPPPEQMEPLIDPVDTPEADAEEDAAAKKSKRGKRIAGL